MKSSIPTLAAELVPGLEVDAALSSRENVMTHLPAALFFNQFDVLAVDTLMTGGIAFQSARDCRCVSKSRSSEGGLHRPRPSWKLVNRLTFFVRIWRNLEVELQSRLDPID